MADQVRRLEPQRGEQLVVDQREVDHVVQRLKAGRSPHARMERGMDRVATSQAVEEGRPALALVERVEVDQRARPRPAESTLKDSAPARRVTLRASGVMTPLPAGAPDGHQRSL